MLDTIDLTHLERLRLNLSSNNEKDCEGVVWDKMITYAKNFEDAEGIDMKEKWKLAISRLPALYGLPNRFMEVFRGRWNAQVTQLIQYPGFQDSFYANALE